MKTFLKDYWYCLTFKNVRDEVVNNSHYLIIGYMMFLSMLIWFGTLLELFAIYKIIAG